MFYNATGEYIILEKPENIIENFKTIGKTSTNVVSNIPSKNTITKFVCPTDKYEYENSIYNFTDSSNNILPNMECLVLPGRVWDGEKERNFVVTMADPGCTEKKCNATGNHGYEIFIINPNPVNTIFVKIIKPNFFTIINTKYMEKNGKIKFETNENNKNLRFILINDINDNDNFILTTDKDGNKCRNPDDVNIKQKYNFSLEPSIEKLREIEYTGNPRIYIMGDYLPCNISKLNKITNVYVYIDNGLTPDATNKCLGKLKLSHNYSDAVKAFYIKENHNGFIFENYISRSIIIDFDPRDVLGRNGFITIINTLNPKKPKINIQNGVISFNDEILKNLLKKIQCYYVRFWLSNLNLTSDNEIVDIKSRKGPYKSISFTGNPKIIIYIPPHIFKPLDKNNVIKVTTPVNTLMTDYEIDIRKEIYTNKNVQIQETSVLDVLDIYISIVY